MTEALEKYKVQVGLLVRTLPYFSQEHCFALKGGTAINLFVRDLPRLSVDIDLTYLPVADRVQSLDGIDGALRRIGERIEDDFPSARVQVRALKESGTATKVYVRDHKLGTQIKAEVTPVFRGCVFDPEEMVVHPIVAERFGGASMKVASFGDLFAGKLVAALDRQHPRDLFDVHGLLANEGVSDDLRTAFLVYLLSDSPSIESLLMPPRRKLRVKYECELAGMMEQPLTLDNLVQVREEMISEMIEGMPESHCEFLRTFVRGGPEWDLLGVDGVEHLPALKWRMAKMERLNDDDRSLMVRRVEDALPAGASRPSEPWER